MGSYKLWNPELQRIVTNYKRHHDNFYLPLEGNVQVKVSNMDNVTKQTFSDV